MAQITIRVDAEQVKIGLLRFAKQLPDTAERVLSEQFAGRVTKRISGNYRGGNSYAVPLRGGVNRRTGNYGRSTTWVMEGLSIRFFNNAYSRGGYNYGPRLTGDASGHGQAWWAAGRWPIARQIVEEETIPLVGEMDRAVQDSIEAAGL
jgi:hypothetical protein